MSLSRYDSERLLAIEQYFRSEDPDSAAKLDRYSAEVGGAEAQVGAALSKSAVVLGSVGIIVVVLLFAFATALTPGTGDTGAGTDPASSRAPATAPGETSGHVDRTDMEGP